MVVMTPLTEWDNLLCLEPRGGGDAEEDVEFELFWTVSLCFDLVEMKWWKKSATVAATVAVTAMFWMDDIMLARGCRFVVLYIIVDFFSNVSI